MVGATRSTIVGAGGRFPPGDGRNHFAGPRRIVCIVTTGTAVLVGVGDGVATALSDVTVARVEGVAGLEEALDERPGCVVVGVEGTKDPLEAVVDAVDEREPLLPVVLVGPAPRAESAELALDVGATEYVQWPTESGPVALRAAVDSVAEGYGTHRDRARLPQEAPVPAFVLREGTIVAATPDLADVFGREDVDGLALSSLVAEGDVERVRAALGTVGDSESATVEFAPAADDRRTIEACVRRSDGDGAILGRARDVTERAARREELEHAAGMLSSLLENVPMSIYFKDELGRHERVSDYITHTDPEDYIMNDEGKVHPHAEDVIGKTDFDLYAPGFAEETYADDMNVIEDEEGVIGRIEPGTTSLGEPLYTSTTKVPRYDENGNVVGLVGVSIDVTERETHREELERQNDRLNEFAEVLTHDLRNPLNIAQGYLDVLEEGYDETAIEETTLALARVESLIEEIREFVLEGRVVEEPVAVDLRNVARDAWSTVDTGDASLAVEGDLRLKADRPRLRRLFENCFRNAIEHATPDDGDLTVKVVAGDREFAIEDDGLGIPEDVRENVFERGVSTSDDGTGFGLAIVESIAEAHGWSIDLETSDTGGARFVFGDIVRAEQQLGRTIADD